MNNADVNHYAISSNIKSSASKFIEEEQARQFCGIDLVTYNNMVGGRIWSEYAGDLKNGIIICKADVIAYYRIMTKTESVINDLSLKQSKSKGGK